MQLSIVVPVYNSADCLAALVSRIRKETAEYFKRCELILVDDCSTDESWDVITTLAHEHPFVTGVGLRRNVGQDNAIMAGLHYAKGAVVAIMDDDLQHDPADLVRLYQEIQMGYDVVYANFRRKQQASWKNLGSWFNDRIADLVLGKPKEIYMSPYKVIRREVVNEIIRYDGPYTYVDGLIFSITSNVNQVESTHHSRYAGVSNYTLLKSIHVWLKLATDFSVVPLRLATLGGALISCASFIMAAIFFFETLFFDVEPAGWPSLIVAVFMLGGIQLLGIGALGEYIGRIFVTLNKRPQFSIKQVCPPPRERVVVAGTESSKATSA